jgi:hypothetical protein
MIGDQVYFIRAIDVPQGPVKIGCSGSVRWRLGGLQRCSPYNLEVAATIPGGHDLERRFHALFRDSYLRREWFSWTPELEEVIDEIRDGTFDVETLPDGVNLTRKGRKYHVKPPYLRTLYDDGTRSITKLRVVQIPALVLMSEAA